MSTNMRHSYELLKIQKGQVCCVKYLDVSIFFTQGFYIKI